MNGRETIVGMALRRQAFSALASLMLAGTLVVAERGDPEALLERIGVKRGICVIVGDTRGETAISVARHSELLIYCQVARPGDVAVVRRTIDAAGLYGTRVYVGQGQGDRLHLADNVAGGKRRARRGRHRVCRRGDAQLRWNLCLRTGCGERGG